MTWKVADLELDVDAVLRGQGADPAKIRSRSPRLVETARRALVEARELLAPQVLSRQLRVEAVRHETLELEGGVKLTGPLVTQHLAAAQWVFAVFCTIGEQIDEYILSVMADDMVFGLAIDGVGSAAVEALANAVCKDIELQAEEDQLMTTIPLSPGMIGWPVEQGQPVIFELLNPEQIGGELTSSFIMKPRKSLTMLVGLGPVFDTQGSTCDFCAMKETCRYQDHYHNE